MEPNENYTNQYIYFLDFWYSLSDYLFLMIQFVMLVGRRKFTWSPDSTLLYLVYFNNYHEHGLRHKNNWGILCSAPLRDDYFKFFTFHVYNFHHVLASIVNETIALFFRDHVFLSSSAEFWFRSESNDDLIIFI